MDRIIEWLLGAAGVLVVGLSTVLWFMFRDHHSRIQKCEQSNISRTAVEKMVSDVKNHADALVVDVETKFQRDHSRILDTMNTMKSELRQDISGLRRDIWAIFERRATSRD